MVLWIFVATCSFGCCEGFEIRSATDKHISVARKILLREAMNPFSLQKENMLVAVDEENDDDQLIGFGQIRPIDEKFSELASLFVMPEKRNQGIGGTLVQSLMENHKSKATSKVCLLTLKPTASFYEPHGFKIASSDEMQKLPSSVRNEYLAGSAISLVLGNEIICMIQK